MILPCAAVSYRPFRVREKYQRGRKTKNMKIEKLKIENLEQGCVTDRVQPRFSYVLSSEREDNRLQEAEITVNGWKKITSEQIMVPYEGEPLKPYTEYTVTVRAKDIYGETAEKSATFRTGKMNTPWAGKWITHPTYSFTEKKVSPIPMNFKKSISVSKKVKSATIYATAMGIFTLALNGKRVGEDYFAPGFTSYKTRLQYMTYDVTSLLQEGENGLSAVVSGGWAVGAFVFSRVNRVTTDKQALKAEIRIEYEDGEIIVIPTDESWLVSMDGNVRMADIYDGETFDATVDLEKSEWVNASEKRLGFTPALYAAIGSPVKAHRELKPVSVNKIGEELVYDFGQNFAGVVKLKIRGRKGQVVTVRHAEVLKSDGTLFTELLRSAKATATYICVDGEQEYSPTLTYMGFRYISVTGIGEKDIDVSALVLYSDLEENGKFACSDERVNRLQENILWSARSNFMDIPTDCPQRDERMGWTGDIAVFAQTACFNFDMNRFLDKWLGDVRAEQTRGGGIPNTVPVQGYGFPVTMPKKAIAFWGDACVFVPWAQYLSYGDKKVLEENYETMKKYVKACKFWANIGIGKHRYIWNDIPMMQFGDWIAPDVDSMGAWQARCKWTGTGSLAATSGLLSRIAGILGKPDDEKYYKTLHDKVSDAYVSLLTDGNGKLKNEFQTAYVLPLYFDMFPEDQKKKAAENLAALVQKNDHCIGTGFPGTPYILFALADNGQEEEAYRMLLNDKCPSWLYEVKAGGTTIWERWDALKEDGSSNTGAEDGTGGMISFNHYASGAVGDFLYRRILGVEAKEGGYKSFTVAPLVREGLSFAKGEVHTPYGKIATEWKKEAGKFTLQVEVPFGTECTVRLPSGKQEKVKSGKHTFAE